jgi:hypothetical protein
VIAPAATAKLIAGLALALCLSVGINVWQLYRAGVNAGEARGEADRQQLADQNAGLRLREAVSTAIATRRIDQDASLMAELSAIAERSRVARIVYRKAADGTPLPDGCGPGAQRMAAVNASLGPEPAR